MLRKITRKPLAKNIQTYYSEFILLRFYLPFLIQHFSKSFGAVQHSVFSLH